MNAMTTAVIAQSETVSYPSIVSSLVFDVMAGKDSYIHLVLSLPVVSLPPALASTSPLSIVINAPTPFSILDHSLTRNVDRVRVIGTLLGVRNEGEAEVEIRNCFAIGHNESQEQVGPLKSPFLGNYTDLWFVQFKTCT